MLSNQVPPPTDLQLKRMSSADFSVSWALDGPVQRTQRSRVFLPEMPSVSVRSLISHGSGGLKAKIKVLAHGCLGRACFQLHRQLPPCRVLAGRKGPGCSLGSLTRTRLPFLRTGPGRLPEAPPPGAITLGIRFQQMNFVGHKLSFCSTLILGKVLPRNGFS